MKEYSKGIYVKFKPEEVEILHDRMKEAGVQNMSAYIRKMALNGYVIIPEWPDLNRVREPAGQVKWLFSCPAGFIHFYAENLVRLVGRGCSSC